MSQTCSVADLLREHWRRKQWKTWRSMLWKM